MSFDTVRARALLDQGKAHSDDLIDGIVDICVESINDYGFDEDAVHLAVFGAIMAKVGDSPPALAGMLSVTIMRLARAKLGVPQFTALDEVQETDGG
jgi:hypothetical protein